MLLCKKQESLIRIQFERMIVVRYSEKGETVSKSAQPVFGVSFHDFIERENATTSMELASEFGLSLREVKHLKKRLGRS